MRVNAYVAGDWLVAHLDHAPTAYTEMVAETMGNISSYLYDKVYAKLSGGRLQVRSGRLRDALKHDSFVEGNRATARVWIDGVPYARIQERGGMTRPHVIVPRLVEALRFEIGGNIVFAMQVFHPGSRIPESMYMRAVLIEERSRITAMIRQDIKKVEKP